MSALARLLLIIGGLNWCLVGIGHFIGKDLNSIALFAQFTPNLPAIIYILIGLSAIYLIFRR